MRKQLEQGHFDVIEQPVLQTHLCIGPIGFDDRMKSSKGRVKHAGGWRGGCREEGRHYRMGKVDRR